MEFGLPAVSKHDLGQFLNPLDAVFSKGAFGVFGHGPSSGGLLPITAVKTQSAGGTGEARDQGAFPVALGVDGPVGAPIAHGLGQAGPGPQPS